MAPKRTLIVAISSMAFLLVAGLALAAFVSSKQTTSSSFTADSVGDVSIGDADTLSLFSLPAMVPGQVVSACFVATVDNTSDGIEQWRLYSGGVVGTGLEDYLLVTIVSSSVRTDVTPAAAAGIFDCSTFNAAHTMVSDEPLSSYASTTSNYATGDALGTQSAWQVNWVQLKITVELPDTPAVQAGASGLTASTSWVVENQ